jgi:hypothetical protein
MADVWDDWSEAAIRFMPGPLSTIVMEPVKGGNPFGTPSTPASVRWYTAPALGPGWGMETGRQT